MIYKTVIIFFLINLLCSSCNKKEKSDNNNQSINAEFAETDCVKLSDIVESIEIIPLETDLSNLIGNIGKIIKHNNLFYIGAASNIIDKILVFNEKGEFVYKLDKRGVGAGEYTEITDFDVIDKNRIVVVSRSNPGIYVYDMAKDTCLLQKNINIYPNNVMAKNDYFYVMNNGIQFRDNTNDLIFKYDKQGNFIQSLFPMNDSGLKIIASIAPLVSLSTFKNDIYFNYPFSNKIYKISDTSIWPEFELDFGKKSLPENMLNNTKGILDIEQIIRKNEGLYLFQYYAINYPISLFTFFDYQYNGYVLLYNSITKKSLIAHQIIDDLYFKGNKFKIESWKMPKLLDSDGVYYHMEPSDLIKQYEQYKNSSTEKEWSLFCNKHRELIDKLNNMREDDNPVILKIELKK